MIMVGVFGFVLGCACALIGVFYRLRPQQVSAILGQIGELLGANFFCDDNEDGTPKIEFNDGEVQIKQYLAAQLPELRCEAYVTVTNQRLLVSGVARNLFGTITSKIAKQVVVTDIRAVDTDLTTQRSWRVFAVCMFLLGLGEFLVMAGYSWYNQGALGLVGGFAGYLSSGQRFLWGLLQVVNFIIALRVSLKTSFVLRIFTSAASASLNLGEGYASKSALRALRGEPARDTLALIGELGTMVHDICLHGDQVVERWGGDDKTQSETSENHEDEGVGFFTETATSPEAQ